ncbi:hypothetical protein [Streptomyces iconiensis]|uniref:Helix-hairpin-helix motif-containing protein n=1 Tax=Streptomyces iconiensis TaxID=1384038 RepID=A0ABT7A9X9_9ACTN|nr:hypothetical protein [Streptomyces iconiensis]MDJ1138166.1 hypothetical protein [Streptomyces iconiensis]
MRRPLGILWALVPLLSAGTLGWLPFAVRATVHRRTADAATAAGYAAWTVTALVLLDRSSTGTVATGLLVALVAVCTTHTALVSSHGPLLRQHGSDHARETERARAERRDRARRLLEREPQVARELGIGRPDLRGSYDDGGLLDINGVSAQILVRELGWTEAEAADVTAVRERVGGFSGPAELLSLTSIAPPRIDAAASRLVFSTA